MFQVIRQFGIVLVILGAGDVIVDSLWGFTYENIPDQITDKLLVFFRFVQVTDLCSAVDRGMARGSLGCER